MSAGPETHDVRPSDHPGSEARNPTATLTAAQIASYDSSELKDDAAKSAKGSAAASEALLRDAMNVKNSPYLKDVAKDLEKSGNAKIIYGQNGDVEHIVFNGGDGNAPVDIDLQHESVNGKSTPQLRDAEVKQAKEYFAAGLSDPKMTASSGKPLSAEAQSAAKALVGAVLDGDVAAMTKAGQQIMQNPDMAKSIQDVLNKIQFPSPISFRKDANGQPYMQAENGEFDAVIVPATGSAHASHLDYLGAPDNRPPLSLDAAMKSASDWGLVQASSRIDSTQGFLDMVDRLPADGYTNMKDLERAFSEQADPEKVRAMIKKKLDAMTSEQRAEFDKLRKLHQDCRVDN